MLGVESDLVGHMGEIGLLGSNFTGQFQCSGKRKVAYVALVSQGIYDKYFQPFQLLHFAIINVVKVCQIGHVAHSETHHRKA